MYEIYQGNYSEALQAQAKISTFHVGTESSALPSPTYLLQHHYGEFRCWFSTLYCFTVRRNKHRHRLWGAARARAPPI